MRYAFADAIVNSLLMDKKFGDMDISDRSRVLDRILSTIKGFIMEEIVLLETKIACPHMKVCTVQFAVGEFDMVVFDPAACSCEIYEIKHSTKIVPEQMHHLINEEKCRMTEHRFGPITGKYVIYHGPAGTVDDVHYLNVEAYLCDIRA